jgi:pimeloyl-ACP methyl ester carboxylesterase
MLPTLLAVLLAGCSSPQAVTVVAREPINSDTSTPDVSTADTEPPDTEPAGSEPADTEPADSEPADTTDEGEPSLGAIQWKRLDGPLDEGHLLVPLSYDDPTGPTIDLYLVRHRATDENNRIGTLLVNPGGPGFGGTSLAYSAEFIYGEEVLERFDIIGWDPRGTGESEPAVDCIDEYDPYFGLDSSPDDQAERDALIAKADEFAAACQENSGELLAHIGTADSARDVDSIREALGEATISFFGFSYGSELGAVWATLFPDTVRALVIDGAADITSPYLGQNIQQAAGFEAVFTTFLAQCSSRSSCPFHNDGDAEGAFDALAAGIDEGSLELDGRLPITHGVLFTAVTQAMYSESSWPALEEALADAQRGDGDALVELYDNYFGLFDGIASGNELEAYFGINCLDDPGSTGPDDLYTHEAEFAAAAPRLGRAWMAELTFCSRWPVPPAAAQVADGKGAGPIVVVGTTGDPATPLQGTRNTAGALEDGRLIVVEGDQHTGYGLNECVIDAVDGYLVDPSSAPQTELFCA